MKNEQLIDFVNKYQHKTWNWTALSLNKNITMNIILEYPEKPWNWNMLSKNINFNFDIVEKYPQKPWNWKYLSLNRNITMDIIEKYEDKWDWRALSSNHCITVDIFEKYHEKPWDWYWLSRNFGITIDIINKYYQKPWNYMLLLGNPNINMNNIEILHKSIISHINLRVGMSHISTNPNITFDFIEKHMDWIWDWNNLSYNKFTLQNNLNKQYILLNIYKYSSLPLELINQIYSFISDSLTPPYGVSY